MGSTTGKKHKKDKKHRHRSRSHSRSVDEVREVDARYPDESEDGARSSSHSRHHSKGHRSSKQYTEELPTQSIYVADEANGDQSERRHRQKHKKHKEHKERHKHHKQAREERERRRGADQQVIALEESDSDSSDCVEVPVDAPPPPNIRRSVDELVAPPPPPLVSKQLEYERREREKTRDREKELREREKELREREKELREREREKEQREREREKELREREREKAQRERQREQERYERERYEREREIERRREKDMERERAERERERDGERRHQNDRREREREKQRSRSVSPVPENGAGLSLSIEETNKMRAKLGMKPLEVDSGPTNASASTSSEARKGLTAAEKDLSSYKDEWGEFLHKPADNLKEKAAAEKMREKLKQRKEKRFLEERLAHIQTLGESDEEVDDVSKWVQRNKRAVDDKKEAAKRAKALEEMDAEFGVDELVEREQRETRRKAYSDKHLKGLRVEHDMDDFSEGKTVILTLKDKAVLDEEDGDTLVNVNMIDDERYRKNVQNKKKNPLSYGYNVYEEQYDQFGNPIDRGVLEKYDEDLDGNATYKKNFVIGENLEEEREHRRKLLEIQTKLAGKRLETLADMKLQLASDTFSETELAKFKKPKKKVKKLRQRLKAEDLLPLGAEPAAQHHGTRRGRHPGQDDDEEENGMDTKDGYDPVKVEQEDEEDDLQRVLAKARKLKQKENIIQKPLLDMESIKPEIKMETQDDGSDGLTRNADGNIVLNATAEFCRTLGDIPTYGMAGNRDEDSNDMMDYDLNGSGVGGGGAGGPGGDERSALKHDDEEVEASTGTWNSVNPEDVMRPMELEEVVEDMEEVAILDEEPDVGAGVANALRLALSKGYLEKEEHNRPSNTKMAHLQAKNYSIDDKAQVEDDKFGRRDRFHAGPIMDFRDKDNFKPNVKLDYIDDNGRILNSKEAFRYLSHKFHGKGPGKNKIEKRLKKMEQEGLMKTMSSTDTPLGTLTMLQQKQKETKAPYVVLSGGKQTAASVATTTLSKYK